MFSEWQQLWHLPNLCFRFVFFQHICKKCKSWFARNFLVQCYFCSLNNFNTKIKVVKFTISFSNIWNSRRNGKIGKNIIDSWKILSKKNYSSLITNVYDPLPLVSNPLPLVSHPLQARIQRGSLCSYITEMECEIATEMLIWR